MSENNENINNENNSGEENTNNQNENNTNNEPEENINNENNQTSNQNNEESNEEQNIDDENNNETIENPYSFVFESRDQVGCEYNFEEKEIVLTLSENAEENFVRFKAYVYFENELYNEQKFTVAILDSENYDYSVTVNNVYIEIYNACDFYVVFNNTSLNILETIHIYAV